MEQKNKTLKVNFNEKALFELDDFCKNNSIEYMITGTLALSLLGVTPYYIPHNIDIKVYHITDRQLAKLKEIQKLSGVNDAHDDAYDNEKIYTIIVCGIHVNIFIDDTENYDDIASNEVILDYIDNYKCIHRNIGVQRAYFAIKDKMALNRYKDKEFMFNLINMLTSL